MSSARYPEEFKIEAVKLVTERSVLVKGRCRGGSVLRAQGSGGSVAGQVLKNAHERLAPVNAARLQVMHSAEIFSCRPIGMVPQEGVKKKMAVSNEGGASLPHC